MIQEVHCNEHKKDIIIDNINLIKMIKNQNDKKSK